MGNRNCNLQGTVDDCIMIEEDDNDINDGNKQVELATVESTEQGALMTAEQPPMKATEQSIDPSDKQLHSKGDLLISTHFFGCLSFCLLSE